MTDFDRHYIYHPAWAMRVLREIAPTHHVDIGSTLYFAAILSAYIPVDYYDFRPPALVLDNLKCGFVDLLNLSFKADSVSSLSCMHVIEHIGLGRYGDALDPEGDRKAASELKRVLRPGGSLLVVVPVGGNPRIIFNAHRIYSYSQIIDFFSGLALQEFALVPDTPGGGLIRNCNQEPADAEDYGCGCFWFIKQ